MPKASPSSAGQAAETQALKYLQGQGLQLLTRNWRCKGGELDLVMLDADTVVFVEVRYRLHADFGGALGIAMHDHGIDTAGEMLRIVPVLLQCLRFFRYLR